MNFIQIDKYDIKVNSQIKSNEKIQIIHSKIEENNLLNEFNLLKLDMNQSQILETKHERKKSAMSNNLNSIKDTSEMISSISIINSPTNIS